MNATLRPWAALAPIVLSLMLVACGGGEVADTTAPPLVEKQCDNTVPPGTGHDDPSCGDVAVEITDADGDFVAYEVDVSSLRLRRADGVRVELLPNRARVDFAQLVQLAELLTSARVPPGTYTAVEMTLDYSAARVAVESGGAAVDAIVHLPPGPATDIAHVTVGLEPSHPLVVVAGTPALLTLDFDLAASHTVSLGTNPPTVTLEQAVLVATVDRSLSDRDHRVRGPLQAADAAAQSYTVAVRPMFRADGHFGRFTVRTNASTEFEVDGVAAVGPAGFALLAAKGQGTATVALGRYDTTLHGFIASRVQAGSSVPGGDLDGAVGAVRARNGDTVMLHGATFFRATGGFTFAEDITVLLDPQATQVRVAGSTAPQSLAAISVGSRLEILGAATTDAGGHITIAAQRVRVVPTTLTGTVVGLSNGILTAQLQSIDRRRVALFDFAGTGTDAAHDADPATYEIELGMLQGGSLQAGDPIGVQGLVAAFGQAPVDFRASTLIDYSTARAEIVVGWGSSGTTAPFSTLAGGGIQVDLANPSIGLLHHLKRGPVVTDLRSLPSSPLLTLGEDPVAFVVVAAGTVQVHTGFGEFVAAVQANLASGDRMRLFYARGRYDEQGNALAAQMMVAVFD